jgi:hypothetical protein
MRLASAHPHAALRTIRCSRQRTKRNNANCTLPEPNTRTFTGLNMTETSRMKLRSRGNENKHHVKVRSSVLKIDMCGDQIINSDVLKCLVVVDTSLVMIDVIQYQKKFWLVPEWLDSSDGRWCTPRRIICADKLRHYDLRAIGTEAADFALDETLTEELLNGTSTSGKTSKYQIINAPGCRVRKNTIN